MARKNELISYAMDLASYLVLKVEGIDRIILYGSVARGDFNDSSDVDLFVDIQAGKQKQKIGRVVEDYYKTKKFNEWKIKGINNSFSVICGVLDGEEWKDLKRAMFGNGLILYSRFSGVAEKMQQYSLFSFENIKPDKKRVAVFRTLFGFNIGKKNYEGIVRKMNGARIGKGSILIPASMANELKKYFNDRKVSVKIYDFWSDSV